MSKISPLDKLYAKLDKEEDGFDDIIFGDDEEEKEQKKTEEEIYEAGYKKGYNDCIRWIIRYATTLIK